VNQISEFSLRHLLIIALLIGLATRCDGAVSRYRADLWCLSSPAIVIGETIAVEPVEPRELGRASLAGWLFPHDLACIVVSEVLKNSSGCELAIGDTVAVYYATDSKGKNPSLPNPWLFVENTGREHLVQGQAGAFALKCGQGGWAFASFYHMREESEFPEIRTVVSDLCPEIWVGSSSLITVVDVLYEVRVERRKLESGRHSECSFDHGIRKMVVVEVLKNQAKESVAVGDTIAVCYPSSNNGHNPDRPGMVKEVEGVALPYLRPGRRSILALNSVRGEWHAGTHYYYRAGFEEPVIREALTPGP